MNFLDTVFQKKIIPHNQPFKSFDYAYVSHGSPPDVPNPDKSANGYKHYPNALKVTSQPGSILSAKCTAAYNMHKDGISNGKFMVSMYSDNLQDHKPQLCSIVSDQTGVCLPPGTIALPCMGQQVDGGKYNLAPSWIAVPKSEALYDVGDGGYRGCHGQKHHDPKDKFNYVKTSNFQKPYSNYKNLLNPGH